MAGTSRGNKISTSALIGENVKVTVAGASINILRGAHTGELIVGKENPHASFFITANQLMTTAEKKRQGEGESSQQTSTTIEHLEILSTQQSMTMVVS
ncbi:hypothetical protein DsansV1_C23g0174801 [Dioscorea sansibarensis]